LIWLGQSAVPYPNALGGDRELVDSIHLDGRASGSGILSKLLKSWTMSSPPIVALMIRRTTEVAPSAPAGSLKTIGPTTPIVVKVAR
jgi:hypothetical protein